MREFLFLDGGRNFGPASESASEKSSVSYTDKGRHRELRAFGNENMGLTEYIYTERERDL